MALPLTVGQWLIAGFTAAYLASAAVAAVITGNGEFVFYLVVMLVLVGALAAVHWRVGFTTPLLALLSLWGALHMAGGLVPVPEGWPINGEQRVLYSWWVVPFARDASGGGAVTAGIKYDHLVHAFGFGVTTWACWQGLVAATGARRPTVGLLTLVGAAAMGFGALNEVVEFAATMMGPTNVGGYVNTGFDLVSNLVGVLIAVVLIGVSPRDADGQPGRDVSRSPGDA